MFSLVLVALLGVGLFARQAAAPQPQPDRQTPPITFKVEINYVEVDAVVTDAKGSFAGNLRPNDFQVFEDGKPQTITNFSLVEIPMERPDSPLFVKQPIEPDVATNADQSDGRLYLIVLDALHTEALHSAWVRKAAKKFIETSVAANDRAAVISTGGDASQDFTNNKRLLLAAVDRFMGRSLRSATLNKIDDYNATAGTGLASDKPRDIDTYERAHNATATLDTLRQASDFMASIHGRRKALVLFSEGIDYDITDPFENQSANDIRQDSLDAVAAATRANVVVYSIDPRGLSSFAGMGAENQGPPIDADPSLRLNAQGMQDEFRLQQDSLRVLADETGGFAALNSNDFVSTFDRIRQENSSYYVLGYYPTNDKRDGRFRKIEVRINKPGFRVRARKGYVAPRGRASATRTLDAKEGTSPVLREALNSPLPLPGLRLTAFAAPFRGSGTSASVSLVVHADGRDLKFTEKDGRFEDTVELSVIALDKDGKVKNGVTNKVRMPLKPQTYALVAQTGIRVTSRLDLPPGHYQLRIAAMDVNRQATGAVHYELDVPDFTAGAMSMSGLVFTSTLSGLTPSVSGEGEDQLRKLLPGPVTVVRDFRVGEELTVLSEIYDNQGKTPHRVDIATTLRSDDGRELYKHEDERSSSELGGARGGYGYTAKIPLKGLSPGLYVVKVEARSRLAKGPTVSREVQIRVTQ
jgi:VWFA-related protein